MPHETVEEKCRYPLVGLAARRWGGASVGALLQVVRDDAARVGNLVDALTAQEGTGLRALARPSADRKPGVRRHTFAELAATELHGDRALVDAPHPHALSVLLPPFSMRARKASWSCRCPPDVLSQRRRLC